MEPLTYYEVTRALREFGGRRAGLGLLSTAVVRRFDDPALETQLNRASLMAGIDGWWFLDKVTNYAKERIVFDRPIGQNQGVQFPIARAYVNIEAASLMRFEAAERFDRGEPCGPQANMAKLLASEASWAGANACLDTHGGFGFAQELDVERKFRETRLYSVAPLSNNLVLAYLGQHVLGMPRSY